MIASLLYSGLAELPPVTNPLITAHHVMFMICGLLAASLIDAETFTIPLQIPWLMAVGGIIVHAIIDGPRTPNHLNVSPTSVSGPLALGGSIGLIISIVLFLVGIMPQS